MRSIVLIAHNLRSIHNVGSLLRTADGMGLVMVYLSGYTPHPGTEHDERLPHEVQRIERQIHKTAIGAEQTQPWQYEPDIFRAIGQLRHQGYTIAALEQSSTATALPGLKPPEKIALIVGREVEGVEKEVLAICDTTLEIPMLGQKESYNVVQAAAMALYHCRFS